MQRTLIIIGLVVLITGVLWPWVSQLPIGRLPGDLLIERLGLKIYLPVTTLLLFSILISLLLYLFRG